VTFTLNLYVYENVLNLTIITSLIIATIFFAISLKNRRNSMVVGFIMFLLISISLFFIIPSYTYSQAVKLVLNEHSGEQNEDVQRIVPVSGGYHFFAPNWFYHVVIKEDGEEQRYMVNPNSGEILGIE